MMQQQGTEFGQRMQQARLGPHKWTRDVPKRVMSPSSVGSEPSMPEREAKNISVGAKWDNKGLVNETAYTVSMSTHLHNNTMNQDAPRLTSARISLGMLPSKAANDTSNVPKVVWLKHKYSTI